MAAFGEEIGWRGFLLPLLTEELGIQKAVLLNGILWGIAHAPLVCFGLNYTGDYPGAPWYGILMMVLFATSTGIFLSDLTLKSRSIFPACIAHGAINAIREAHGLSDPGIFRDQALPFYPGFYRLRPCLKNKYCTNCGLVRK